MANIVEHIGYIYPVDIIIVGKKGCGKTSLAKAVINYKDTKYTAENVIIRPFETYDNVMMYYTEHSPIVMYDIPGFGLDSQENTICERAVEDILSGNDIHGYTEEHCQKQKIIWYCINSMTKRVETSEYEYIKQWHKRYPVIIVMTKCYENSYNLNAFADYITAMLKKDNINNIPIVKTVSKQFDINNYTIDTFGLRTLISETTEQVETRIDNVFEEDYVKKFILKSEGELWNDCYRYVSENYKDNKVHIRYDSIKYFLNKVTLIVFGKDFEYIEKDKEGKKYFNKYVSRHLNNLDNRFSCDIFNPIKNMQDGELNKTLEYVYKKYRSGCYDNEYSTYNSDNRAGKELLVLGYEYIAIVLEAMRKNKEYNISYCKQEMDIVEKGL